ncbi:MAG: L-histidine N(alpha)-methyltransferase [Allomuricauda sp.]|nr:MAG: L-histidine N(alpha)-methyltransferase [Allomuricauda sp.]
MQQDALSAQRTAFGQEVYEGLTSFPKQLSSKYFYDEIGDKLFQDIMAMPEYYLTNAEMAIFQTRKTEIANLFSRTGKPFSLYELGAGDGKKTKILLQELIDQKASFDYRPIDISQNALDQLKATVNDELPEVVIDPLQGTYYETLAAIREENTKNKVILFLGSNIGNLLHPQAIDFLTQLKDTMNTDDLLFMGMDQKKHPQTILDAYNDASGITEAFNKNVLTRINKEFGGDFDIQKFLHWEVYDPESGTAKSYLVAKEAFTVTIKDLDLQVHFRAWETIHTEISQKYDDEVVSWLADQAGLEVTNSFSDADQNYKNYVFKTKKL